MAQQLFSPEKVGGIFYYCDVCSGELDGKKYKVITWKNMKKDVCLDCISKLEQHALQTKTKEIDYFRVRL